jgi:hypothetical protein
LAGILGRCYVNTDSRQMLDMASPASRADDMNRFVAAVETILNEWQENTVFFVLAVEECADVAWSRQLSTCKRDRLRYPCHVISFTVCAAP